MTPAAGAFIGRAAELQALEALADSPGLATVVGPAGVGKTRLVHEWVASSGENALVVELGAASGLDDMIQQIAAAIGVDDRSGPTRDAVVAALQGHRRLVLDNCEHVAREVSELVASVSEALPALSIVATSRQPIGAPGERTLPLAPLRVPDAVQLFAARWRERVSASELTDDDTASAARLCQRLDGLPLAIELAASRAHTMTVADLEQHLAARLDMSDLATPPGARHETLRASIAWSYALLTDSERAVFRRFAIFHGAVAIPEIEHVCGYAPLDSADVVPLLIGLVDKSLVVADLSGRHTRYRMLQSIADFARSELARADDGDPPRQRHSEFFADWIRANCDFHAEPELLDAAAAHEGEITQALAFLIAHDPRRAVAVAGDMWLYWALRGHWRRGLVWLERCLDAAPDAPAGDRAVAQQGAAAIANALGDHDRARRHLEDSLSWSRAQGGGVLAQALSTLSQIALGVGDLDDAEAWAAEAHAAAVADADENRRLYALLDTGAVLLHRGRLEAAEAACDDALLLARKLGTGYHAGPAQLNAASAALGLGNFGRAAARAEAGAADFAAVGEMGTAAIGWITVAHARTAMNDLAGAGTALAAARRLLADTQFPAAEANLLIADAALSRRRCDLTAARRSLESALALGGQSPIYGATALVAAADVALAEGDHTQAARRAEAALADEGIGIYFELAPMALAVLSSSAVRSGRYADAVQYARRGAELLSATDALWPQQEILECLAAALVAVQDWDAAAIAAGCADALRTRSDGVQPDSDAEAGLETRSAIGRALGSEAQAAFDRGAELPFIDVVGAVGEADATSRPARVRITTLGRFAVERDGDPVPFAAWQSRKARDVVKIIISRRGGPVTRDALIDLLWPEEDPDPLPQRLSQALTTARNVLGTATLITDGGAVALDRESVTIDAFEFLDDSQEALALHRDGSPGAAAALRRAHSRHSGEFLPEDPYEEWSITMREQVRAQFAAVGRALAACDAEAGDLAAASALLVDVVERDPYDEAAHLELIGVLIRAGNHGEARRRQEIYEARMAELGVDPASL